MAIRICDNNIFVLETKNTHYVIGIDTLGYNRHIHWGGKCDVRDYSMHTYGDENSNHSQLDNFKQEYTPFGKTLYRDCSLKAYFADGCRETEIEYCGYKSDKNELSLTFMDNCYALEITLNYRIFDDSDIIERWTTVRNTGKDTIRFEKLFSAEFNLPSANPYTFMNTNGAWGAEGITAESTLEGGALVFESRRGTSGHNQSPYFIALQNADEKSGDVYFAALAYSGSFKVTASRDLFGTTRIGMGLNDFDFAHILEAGESFDTPPVYCGYTQGLGEMSRQLNRFAVENVLPKSFAAKPLPVLYNSWEATGFDVSVDGQTKLAERAARTGVELFVMDDGWFAGRNDDRAGLGDWFVNKEKFPNGLDELIENVNKLGMDFGIWVEPEMVNKDSDLFRAHPDWAYHYDTRTACELRHQLVLNMTRSDVQEYIRSCLDELLSNHNIKYIKWDMNRPFSETGAQNLAEPKMLWYLHTKAVYDIVDYLKAKHPDVAIESCSSGGGRTDYGALLHFDQTWPSDNTDAIDRMVIQKNYTLTRPTKTMRAWVTDICGINKATSLDFRFNIAMQGALSIGGNLLKYTDEELEICKKNIELYKSIRNIVQFGDLYRLLDIDKDEVLANQYISRDKSEGVIFIAANGTRFFKKRIPLLFDGLDSQARYRINAWGKEIEKSGSYLMNVGLPLEARGKDYNTIIKFSKI